jgi:translation initiation factor IF-3
MLQKMVEAVQDLASVESNPRMEGRMLHLVLSPKPQQQHTAQAH